MEKFPQQPSPENIDSAIEKLLENLYERAELFDKLGPELQEKWYWVEQEAEVGKDRAAAKAKLEEFLKVLEEREKSL